MIGLPSTSTNPLQDEITDLYSRVNAEWNRLNFLVTLGTDLVWANDQGYTPQQVVAALGQNAVSILQLSSVIAGVISTVSGITPSTIPPGWGVKPNADGTVTLTAPVGQTSTSSTASSTVSIGL
jgi:hypothetical protein